MKHIKLFEELDIHSIPNEAEIKDGVDDIFVELEDEGFTVFKKLGYSRTNEINFYLEVRITKGDGELFDTKIVKQKTEMLIDYVKGIWFHIYMRFYIKDNVSGELMNDMNDKEFDKANFFTFTINKINYKPTFIDKVNKFFKRK